MNVAGLVKKYVDGCDLRDPIFVSEVKVPEHFVNARNVAFYRLEKSNYIKLYRKGIYYKPKFTRFGEIGIDEEKLIDTMYMNIKGKINGYITGPTLWNAFGITAQVPNRIWVATNFVKRNVNFDKMNLKLIKPKVKIDKTNYRVLQFLDLIDQIYEIQDLDYKKYIEILTQRLKGFDTQELGYILNYANYYNKFVRNFTGALIEKAFIQEKEYTEIKVMLNIMKNEAVSNNRIKIYINYSLLENMKDWGFIDAAA
jgi:hypothetical protein